MSPNRRPKSHARQSKTTKEKLSRDEYYNEIHTIITELQSQTDRGAAIVGVALLDEKLRQALEASFDPSLAPAERAELFEGPTAPLSTYAARVRLGRALGLYRQDFAHELALFGRIRNRFAHKLDVREFASPSIATLCSQLRGGRSQRYLGNGNWETMAPYRSEADARRVFLVSIEIAVHTLFTFAQSHRRGGHSRRWINRGLDKLQPRHN